MNDDDFDSLLQDIDDPAPTSLRLAVRNIVASPSAPSTRHRLGRCVLVAAAVVAVITAGAIALWPRGANRTVTDTGTPTTVMTVDSALSTDPTNSDTSTTELSAMSTTAAEVVRTDVRIELPDDAPVLSPYRDFYDVTSGYNTKEVRVRPDGAVALVTHTADAFGIEIVAPGRDPVDLGVDLPDADFDFGFGPNGDLFLIEVGDTTVIRRAVEQGDGSWSWSTSASDGASGDCRFTARPSFVGCVGTSGGATAAVDPPAPFAWADVTSPILEAEQGAILRDGPTGTFEWRVTFAGAPDLACTGEGCRRQVDPGPGNSVVFYPYISVIQTDVNDQRNKAVFVLDDRDVAIGAYLAASVQSVVGVAGDDLIVVDAPTPSTLQLAAIDLTPMLSDDDDDLVVDVALDEPLERVDRYPIDFVFAGQAGTSTVVPGVGLVTSGEDDDSMTTFSMYGVESDHSLSPIGITHSNYWQAMGGPDGRLYLFDSTTLSAYRFVDGHAELDAGPVSVTPDQLCDMQVTFSSVTCADASLPVGEPVEGGAVAIASQSQPVGGPIVTGATPWCGRSGRPQCLRFDGDVGRVLVTPMMAADGSHIVIGSAVTVEVGGSRRSGWIVAGYVIGLDGTLLYTWSHDQVEVYDLAALVG